jgi:hypothetical protein
MPEESETPAPETDKLVEAQFAITLFVNPDGKRGIILSLGEDPPDTFTLLGMLASAQEMVARSLN